jgi:hypothetical protein
MQGTFSQTPTEELFPWHKPAIQQLVVNFDTRNSTGSGPDGLTVEAFPE